MGAKFIGGDREQVFVMPPLVADWVSEEHLVWTVLAAVGELDLSGFYAEYRQDGHGRPAYEPSMMVALLPYAYARGNRSSRGIERACVEDVADRVVTGNLAPDHWTIAGFRCRHERPLGEVCTGVLGLCARAGLVSVGVVAIDGTKMSANASINANRDSGRIAREVVAEAAEIDRREDERYGPKRGDEPPERLRTREGRREAKERLDRERAEVADSGDDDEVAIALDPRRFVTRPQGRRAWLREGRPELDATREREGRPVARGRADRRFEACRRLERELDVDHASNAADEARRGRRRNATDGPRDDEALPAARGADGSGQCHRPRLRGGAHAWPAAAAGRQRAARRQRRAGHGRAEITTESPDFGHLEPMVRATQREPAAVDVRDPEVVVADAGYWHQRQIEAVVGDGIRVLVPPDGGLRPGPRPGWTGGLYDLMRRVLATPPGAPSTASAGSRSSPSSTRRSSTARSDASNAAAGRHAGANGGSSPPRTTSTSSTATASPPETAGGAVGAPHASVARSGEAEYRRGISRQPPSIPAANGRSSPARRDGSFPEKQESDPARLLVVLFERQLEVRAPLRPQC